jgi:hypothetical protein
VTEPARTGVDDNKSVIAGCDAFFPWLEVVAQIEMRDKMEKKRKEWRTEKSIHSTYHGETRPRSKTKGYRLGHGREQRGCRYHRWTGAFFGPHSLFVVVGVDEHDKAKKES